MGSSLRTSSAPSHRFGRFAQGRSPPPKIAVGRPVEGATNVLSDAQTANHDHRFWSSYIGLGLFVLAGESLAVVTYLLFTPNGPHRTALLAISTSSAAFSLATVFVVSSVSSKPWRTKFSLIWTIWSGVILTVAVLLDGGFNSPLVFLLILPIASAALVLSTPAVFLCGVATLGELGIVVRFGPSEHQSYRNIGMFSAALVGLVVLSIGWSIGRARLKQAEAELQSRLKLFAQTDSLTGCLNHGAFYSRLEAEINRSTRHGEPLCLLMIDVDLFKAYNDTYGHLAGDIALKTEGNVLTSESRNYDVVGRVGGDEFTVILPNTAIELAESIANRLRVALERPTGIATTSSIGVALLDPLNPTVARLVNDADDGLYQAKHAGRNDVVSKGDPFLREEVIGEELLETVSNLAHDQANIKLLEEHIREQSRSLEVSDAILDAFQESELVGLGFNDRDFRLIRINSMLAAVNGGSVEDQIGKSAAEIVPDLWPKIEPLYRSVLDENKPISNIEVSGAIASDPDNVHTWLSSFFPVTIANEVIGVAVVAVDISDRKKVEESNAQLTRSVVAALASAVEIRDPYTAGHEERVANIAVSIANNLHIELEEIVAIDLAARIHDLGKIAVPAELLVRPGSINRAERELVQTHAQAGYDILQRVDFPKHISEMVLQHHERLDGSGYPSGLSGEEICCGARIIAVADVVESMLTNRPYRAAVTLEGTRAELRGGAGSLYDPDVVASVLRLIEGGQIAGATRCMP